MKINLTAVLAIVSCGLAGYMLYRKLREGENREAHALPISYQAHAGQIDAAQGTSNLAPRHPAAVAMKTVQNAQRSCACA